MPLMEPIEGCSSVCSTISHAPGMILLRMLLMEKELAPTSCHRAESSYNESDFGGDGLRLDRN
jgi:hypothetical protein